MSGQAAQLVIPAGASKNCTIMKYYIFCSYLAVTVFVLQACGTDHKIGGASMAPPSYPACLTDVSPDFRSEVAGIDISHWNGDILWKEVNRESIYFVYMKATEGTDYVDPSFAANWTGARNTSLRRGAYHYFLPGLSDARQILQAQNFINTIKPLQKGDLRPMLDVEDDPQTTVEQFQRRLSIVINEIEVSLKVRPIIYTTSELYKKYLSTSEKFRAYDMWIAQYARVRPELCDGKTVYIWQFTDKAKIRGVSKPVDMDILYTRVADLDKLIIKE